MKIAYALMLPATAIAVGCASPAPVAQNFPVSYQKVARTAHHWDVVAEDVVAQTLQSIAEKPQLQGRGIFVAKGRNTAFDTAFREFTITRLVASGASVGVCKMDNKASSGFSIDGPDVEIKYDTQLVRHGANIPDYQPGRYTLLTAGVAVIRNVILGGDSTTGVIGGVALGEWLAGHVATQTNTEIIVTTTISEHNRFVVRKSDIYYVPDADAQLFIQHVATRSHCPEDKKKTVADAPDEASQAMARQELLEREMRHVNPEWHSSAAYSY